ncbi:unnamed protein product, partial [Symbiodinium necroappetens]
MAFDGDFSFVPWVFMRDACIEGTDRPDLRSTLDISTYQQRDKPDRVERSWENDKVRSRLMELDYQAAWVLHQTEADIMAWVAVLALTLHNHPDQKAGQTCFSSVPAGKEHPGRPPRKGDKGVRESAPHQAMVASEELWQSMPALAWCFYKLGWRDFHGLGQSSPNGSDYCHEHVPHLLSAIIGTDRSDERSRQFRNIFSFYNEKTMKLRTEETVPLDYKLDYRDGWPDMSQAWMWQRSSYESFYGGGPKGRKGKGKGKGKGKSAWGKSQRRSEGFIPPTNDGGQSSTGQASGAQASQ